MLIAFAARHCILASYVGLARIFEGLALKRLRELLETVPDAATRALIEIELERRIPLDDAATFNSVHRTTFKKHSRIWSSGSVRGSSWSSLRRALTLPPLSTR